MRHSEDMNLSIVDIVFEVVSAFATVGLTLGITSQLTFAGKIIIISLIVVITAIAITSYKSYKKYHNI